MCVNEYRKNNGAVFENKNLLVDLISWIASERKRHSPTPK